MSPRTILNWDPVWGVRTQKADRLWPRLRELQRGGRGVRGGAGLASKVHGRWGL